MSPKCLLLGACLLLSGCAVSAEWLGTGGLNAPPEFNQAIMLEVSDDAEPLQAQTTRYDVVDLQAFHTQHTLPLTIEAAFREMFGGVRVVKSGARIETAPPEVPAVFEVRVIELNHDRTFESADTYRAELTLAVAMKSPKGQVFWQRAFRGDGYTKIDPQFSLGLGPEDAVVDALQDAVDQMQDAILRSPEISAQLKYYQASAEARKSQDTAP